MFIQNQILDFAKKHSLKEKALASIDNVIDSSIKSDNEIGIDFLDGNNKTDLIYEFGNFEFKIDKNHICNIVTRINIYSRKLYNSNIDAPVGYYEEWTDLEGQHLDEFLVFDWSILNLNISYCIERINKTIPLRYFKRNIPEYEFSTYVNHMISLSLGRHYNEAYLFVKRCLDYLEKHEDRIIENDYLNECLELFQGIYLFVKNENLVDSKKLNKHKINERIKRQRLLITKM